jgi:protein phosphatase 1 regulatory subunit 7
MSSFKKLDSKAKPPAILGQTWTKQLSCKDPNCIVDHTIGDQHEWQLQENENDDNENENNNESEYKGPADRIVLPLDVLNEIPPADEDMIYIIGTRGEKVTKIANLEQYKNTLKDLILRSNLISSMEGIDELTKLTKLELYDNQLEEISHINQLTLLTILDLSFNSIRTMAPVAACPLLEELYLAQNKLKVIEGLNNMSKLRVLDLGANRIRSMSGCGLSTLVELQSLWLGKNKLSQICDIDYLPKLRQLDCQNNRLTTLFWENSDNDDIIKEKDNNTNNIDDDDATNVNGKEIEGSCLGSNDLEEEQHVYSSNIGIENLKSLEELYLACNAIRNINGLPKNSPLKTIDLSTNQIETLDGIEEYTNIEELWMTSSKLSSFEQLLPLQSLNGIECLYLEHSPIANDYEYRKKITNMLPSLVQLDATEVNRTVS